MFNLPARRRRVIQERLATWYAREARRFPWRDAPSAYHVWVCEIMAQQTRLQVVVPRFRAFVARFPDVAALAAAPLDEVLAAWSGLGYYRRARALHAAARAVCADHGGVLPGDPGALESLPGIGRYTAGAIASIARGLAVPVVDGNVTRVLSRLFDLDDEVDRPPVQRLLWELAARLVPHGNPGGHNQALMELGALVCTPAGPACGRCPLARLCRARRAGTVDERPVRRRKRPPRTVRIVCGAVRGPRGSLLLVQNPYGGLFGGLWQLPLHPPDGTGSAAGGRRGFARALGEALGAAVSVGPRRGAIEHVLTHRRLQVELYDCNVAGCRLKLRGYRAHRWVCKNRDLSGLALATLTRRLLDMLEPGLPA